MTLTKTGHPTRLCFCLECFSEYRRKALFVAIGSATHKSVQGTRIRRHLSQSIHKPLRLGYRYTACSMLEQNVPKANLLPKTESQVFGIKFVLVSAKFWFSNCVKGHPTRLLFCYRCKELGRRSTFIGIYGINEKTTQRTVDASRIKRHLNSVHSKFIRYL